MHHTRQAQSQTTGTHDRRSASHHHVWEEPGIVCGLCWYCRVCGGTHPRYPLARYLFADAPFLALPGMPRGGRFDMSTRERECFARWLAGDQQDRHRERG
jgi:hypothetical protein